MNTADNMPTFPDDDAGRKAFALGYNTALATQVSPQATVEPLTDDEIDAIARPYSTYNVASGSREFDWHGFTRALLAAKRASVGSVEPITETTREKALNTILWFYHRMKPTYGRLGFAEEAIALLGGSQPDSQEKAE